MRLTHRDEYGRWCSDGSKASLQLGYEDYPSILRGDAVDRLAAYEDTGLEPEAVDNLRLSLYGAVAAEIAEEQGYVEVNRVKEIAHAEAEGRLVILPCKVGDKFYRAVKETYGRPDRINKYVCIGFSYVNFDKSGLQIRAYEISDGISHDLKVDVLVSASQFGQDYFLTWEEAKAALKGRRKE